MPRILSALAIPVALLALSAVAHADVAPSGPRCKCAVPGETSSPPLTACAAAGGVALALLAVGRRRRR
jgi:MYXO-CTERM domain-containing protein